MASIRWEPMSEPGPIQNEMNRLFNVFFEGVSPSSASALPRRWVPAMDLVERDDGFVVRADLPGVGDDDVNVELEGDTLTISGERRAEHEAHEEGYYRLERAWGAFARSLTLPEGVEPDAVTARLDRGVLEVRVPKPAQHEPRRVTIAVGANQRERIAAGANGSG